MRTHWAIGMAGVLWSALAAVAAPEAPTGLLVDLLRRPDLCVITNRAPRFGWIVSDPTRGAVQTAYQIVVASENLEIRKDRPATGGMWDSGKVASGQSIDIPYAGLPLKPDSSYYWSVRTWDGKDQASDWSAVQRFNTGEFREKLAWPAESRWVKIKGPGGADLWTFENRHALQYHEIAPSKVAKKGEGQTFIDFGKAAFATIKLTLTAAKDGEVEIHLGEKLAGPEQVDRKPGGSIYYGSYKLAVKRGTQAYTLALPRHVSKYPNSQILAEHMPEVEPFRYAEIIGPVGEIKPDDARQLALFYLWDEQASSFTSSDADLNAVWELCRYTMKASSFMGVYTDGVRERMPYEADAMIQQLGHYCTDREFAIARYSHEYLMYHATWPTEWILQSVEMAWNDYLYTGNADALRKHYDAIKAKALRALAREDGLISTKGGKLTKAVMDSVYYKGKSLRDIVDWPQPGEVDAHEFREINTVVNAWHYRALERMSATAAVLGKADEAKDFATAAAKVKQSINAKLLDSSKGHYIDGEGAKHASLHSNAFPLAFGVTESAKVASVAAFLKTRDMNCGPYGAQFLLDALYNAGEADHAFELMTSKAERSWMNMIRMGSTMTTESWDKKFKPNLTWNHAWGAAPANIIPRRLMGVEPVEPGFARARIRPQVGGKLTRASLKMPTIRGTILVDYQRQGEAKTLSVTIPANMRAVVHVPAAANIKESGVDAAKTAGVKLAADEQDVWQGWTALEVGAGTYKFEYR